MSRSLFLAPSAWRGKHSPSTKQHRLKAKGSVWSFVWLALACLGIRRTFPPLRLIDFQSAEIARKRSKYTNSASKGARVLDMEQYRRTHEIMKRGRA